VDLQGKCKKIFFQIRSKKSQRVGTIFFQSEYLLPGWNYDFTTQNNSLIGPRQHGLEKGWVKMKKNEKKSSSPKFSYIYPEYSMFDRVD